MHSAAGIAATDTLGDLVQALNIYLYSEQQEENFLRRSPRNRSGKQVKRGGRTEIRVPVLPLWCPVQTAPNLANKENTECRDRSELYLLGMARRTQGQGGDTFALMLHRNLQPVGMNSEG